MLCPSFTSMLETFIRETRVANNDEANQADNIREGVPEGGEPESRRPGRGLHVADDERRRWIGRRANSKRSREMYNLIKYLKINPSYNYLRIFK